ncbi:hypothetical protein G4B88_031559 [Cannabis sativa]|uniref:Lunapark zinc ribbon domain-containing protein n=1 Tax=Cannabis sativa TaxID=3483 RepID=A0A7J6EXF0_CANSA|nr:hypothetical protein G4B88_031559 [Cannabis sativa]
MGDDKGVGEGEKLESGTTTTATASEGGKKKKKVRKGIFSRIWNGIFRINGDDFEKRLQYISKEEATVLARIKRRSQTWRPIIRYLIIFSLIFEFSVDDLMFSVLSLFLQISNQLECFDPQAIAIGYAIVTTRTSDMNWKMRAFRVLPIFLLPAISSVTYSAFGSIGDRKDQNTLEKLRAERQAKIDELKERTNYYTTQQLIQVISLMQRYDPDPAAKAAAATVLASKLGADSGLKMFLGDEHEPNVQATMGKSKDVDLVQSGGLRNRKHSNTHSISGEGTHQSPGSEDPAQTSEQSPLVVSHYNPTQGSSAHDGGWIARIAALLVGEDPTQSYALICGNCHMHNGLARKEDFPFITYYCPHCRALNRPHQSEEHVSSGSSTPNSGAIDVLKTANVLASESVVAGDGSIIRAIPENKVEEMTETTEDLAS